MSNRHHVRVSVTKWERLDNAQVEQRQMLHTNDPSSISLNPRGLVSVDLRCLKSSLDLKKQKTKTDTCVIICCE